MPTPSKLFSAVFLAALAWVIGELIVREILPEGTRVGYLREALAVLGLFVGWMVIGKAATGPTGRGERVTVVLTSGIAAGVIGAGLAILLHSFGKMIQISLTGEYTELGRAVNATLSFIWEDVQILLVPIIGGTWFLGAAVIGLLAGIVGRRMP